MRIRSEEEERPGNGMDPARAMYLDLTGQTGERGPVQEARRWMVEVAETGVLAKDDPAPALWMLADNMKKSWRRKAQVPPADYQASRLVMVTRKSGLERSDSSI